MFMRSKVSPKALLVAIAASPIPALVTTFILQSILESGSSAFDSLLLYGLASYVGLAIIGIPTFLGLHHFRMLTFRGILLSSLVMSAGIAFFLMHLFNQDGERFWHFYALIAWFAAPTAICFLLLYRRY